MQNLTKLILNNKIVEFRKAVRQSRIHCIRKLTREIKKLREKKGTDEQKTKNSRKADRYVEEIFAMKRLSDDEVSKFALLNERTLNDITNDVNESLEKKALARLVHHKSIAGKVKNFRETFPEWKSCLEFLLETLGEKYKHKKSMKNSKKKSKMKSGISKIENKNGTSRIENESVISKIENESTTSKIENTSGTWIVELINRKKPTKNVQVTSKCESIDQLIGDKPIDENKPEKLEKKREKAVDKIVKKKLVNDSTVEKKPLVDNADEASITALEEFSEKCSLEKEPEPKGAVDPFFLTKDNAEYISVSARENVSSNQREFEPEQHDRQELPRGSKFNQREFKPHQYNKRGQREFSDTRFKKREFSDTRFQKREFQPQKFGKPVFGRDNRDRNHCKEMPVKPEPSLHPSWEAKKKLAIQCVPFQGKKIKFDDS